VEVFLRGDEFVVAMEPDGAAQEMFELPRTLLARCGPAVVSPTACDSLALWLEPWLEERSTIAFWRVMTSDLIRFDISIAEGRCRLVCLGRVERSPVSRFRHDVRGLLNALNINADLVGMLAAGKGGNPKMKDAAGRIQAASRSLAELVLTWAGEFPAAAAGRLPILAALEDALRRAGFNDIDVKDEDGGQASSLWCFAAARLLIEWSAWLTHPARTSDPAGSLMSREDGRRLQLICDGEGVSLYLEGARRAAQISTLFTVAGNAAPELQLIEPAVILEGMRVGFGCWQTRGATGVRVGIPAS
jgi:hypothetical protein